MHLHRIDLNLLVVLDAIFSEGGITKAGEKLHLTQPAISHALARMRELFGDPLFVREGRRMVPTPLARSLMQPVRRALHGLEVALNEAQRFDPATTQRHFTIGVRDVLEATVLPPLLARIATAAPSVDISAIRVDRRTLESELAAGRLDAALDVLLPVSDDIRHQRISADRLVVVARQGHPATAGQFDLAAYLRAHHVLVSSRRSGPGLEDLELSRQGFKRRIRLRCQHYFAACRVVSQTDLLLTMPERYAAIANRQYANQILPFPVPMPPMDVYLYWHASVDNEPASRWLRAQLIATVEQPQQAA
ncbi:DNA-binding transcriptional regulator, LysR family [Fontimonas thermophila]|uniref:DNA-binding transcriptional regulator, LysR family n=1 Tax=Fontimonas thermophila TaxID=1076937 RepID=A0A1I2JRL6_9GAMM|nr:LysR family transcriptional regulator [Fontimonas thermophila]SFF56603.1 DNA-binding transcriptional regulator, LysR family [Fontimonas thermophila]